MAPALALRALRAMRQMRLVLPLIRAFNVHQERFRRLLVRGNANLAEVDLFLQQVEQRFAVLVDQAHTLLRLEKELVHYFVNLIIYVFVCVCVCVFVTIF
jgi:hypothetical protein